MTGWAAWQKEVAEVSGKLHVVVVEESAETGGPDGGLILDA